MIQCEIDVCSIDNYPIETSKSYAALHKIDPEAAEKTIYQVLIPSDDA